MSSAEERVALSMRVLLSQRPRKSRGIRSGSAGSHVYLLFNIDVITPVLCYLFPTRARL